MRVGRGRGFEPVIDLIHLEELEGTRKGLAIEAGPRRTAFSIDALRISKRDFET